MGSFVMIAMCAARLATAPTWAAIAVTPDAYALVDGPAPLIASTCPQGIPPADPNTVVLCLCPAGFDCRAFFIDLGEFSLGECEMSPPPPPQEVVRRGAWGKH